MTVAGKSTAGQEGADSGIRYRYPGRADHPAGQALEDREREKYRTGPLQRAHPQPPPPRFPNASRHPPGRGRLRQHDPCPGPVGTANGPAVFTATYHYAMGIIYLT